MKVSDILRVKGSTLYTVTPDLPLADAARTMAELDIGSLVVMDLGDLVGMLTFREVIKAVVANGGSFGQRRVRSVMDDAPMTCTPETDINEVRLHVLRDERERVQCRRHTQPLQRRVLALAEDQRLVGRTGVPADCVVGQGHRHLRWRGAATVQRNARLGDE